MTGISESRSLFVTWVYSPESKRNARLMIDSLRAFGGGLKDSPVWIFEAAPERAPCRDLEGDLVRVLPLEVPAPVEGYYYAGKVLACARAESLAPDGMGSIVWISPEILFTKPPLDFTLGGRFDAAVRPVHIQNVGLLVSDPLDDYWKAVYQITGISEIEMSVESFVDVKRLRAYFNSAAFTVNPSIGLMARWFELFQRLVLDQKFQSGPCQDDWHKVFLHQAVLTALIATSITSERLHILPPDYIYPYNLHQDVPPERRPESMNDLICLFYEGRSLNPDEIEDIRVDEPLRSWLSAQG